MNNVKTVKLNDVCDVRDGTHDSPKYVQKGFPLVTSKNVKENSIDFSTCNLISKEDLDSINKRSQVDDGDIIMPMIGTIGNPLIVKKDREFAIKNVALIKFNQNIIYNKFLKYVLSSHLFKDYIEKNKRGGTQKFISLTDIRSFEFHLPSFESQKQIVSILEKAETLKQKRNETNKETQKIIQSLFYEMFGDPVKNEKEWDLQELKEFANLLNGRAYKQNELLDSGKTPVLRVGNFFSNRGWYYSDLDLPEDKYCDQGDLLYAWSASFGPKIWDGPKVIYHYHIWKIELKESINKYFLFQLLQMDSEKIKSSGSGSTMMHATKSGMEKRKFPVPPLPLQEEFAKKVQLIESIQSKQQSSTEEINTLFDALMQKAFKGELAE